MTMEPRRKLETPAERRVRRRATDWYDDAALNTDFVDYLEGLDRRRDFAFRLPVICEDVPHTHSLKCHDSLADTG